MFNGNVFSNLEVDVIKLFHIFCLFAVLICEYPEHFQITNSQFIHRLIRPNYILTVSGYNHKMGNGNGNYNTYIDYYDGTNITFGQVKYKPAKVNTLKCGLASDI